MAVLAERPDDAACGVASEVVLGSPFVAADLRGPHRAVRRGHVRPRAGRPRDRGRAGGRRCRAPARCRDARAGGRQGPHAHGARRRGCPRARPTSWSTAARMRSRPSSAFAETHGWPVMLKAARGGYDGKGVWPVHDRAEAAAVLAERGGPGRGRGAAAPGGRAGGHGGPPPLGYLGRLAGGRDRPGRRGLPGGAGAGPPRARRAGGRLGPGPEGGRDRRRLSASWPWSSSGRGAACWSTRWRPGPTTRVTGRWRAPSPPSSRTTCAACSTCRSAPRPRSTPRWPASTSSAAPVARIPTDLLAHGLAIGGAHVHLYGKEPRPGRKLGHVTVVRRRPRAASGPVPGPPRWPSGPRCPRRGAPSGVPR